MNKKYGFYATLISIAESGLFNRPDQTPLRSAELANLYEVYQFLTYRAELNAAQADK